MNIEFFIIIIIFVVCIYLYFLITKHIKERDERILDEYAKSCRDDRELVLYEIDYHLNVFVKNSFRREIEFYNRMGLKEREQKTIKEFNEYNEYFKNNQ